MKHSLLFLLLAGLLLFGGAAALSQTTESFDGMTTGQRIGQQTGWYDGGTGPTIGATSGVSASKGLGTSASTFTWTANAFNWNDAAFTSVTLGLDFQSSASGTFDDDRVSWTINSSDLGSENEFGVQLDNSDGNNITTYWRSNIASDTRVQTPIVALSGIANSTWYRLRTTITKLTSTSASIDVSLQRLDASGNPTGTPLTGTVPNTSTWAGGAPDNAYFTATSIWPSFKNHNTLAGAADNAYFEEGPGPDFSLILLPDLQNMTQYYPAVLNSMTQWIADNKTTNNIAFVTQTGDIVNTSSSTSQWDNADAAFDILDAASVSYSVGPGNHDLGGLYESYFGVARFTGKSSYGGHYNSDNLNNYSLFSGSGNDFILINLQYSPSTAILDWADALLKANSTRRGIIVQHDILNVDDSWNNQNSYNALKDNPNLFLMLCGHMHTSTDGAAYRSELGDDGHTIHVVQADYQEFANGGDGWLRIMRFSPADDMIYMTTYSPYTTGNIVTDPDQKNLVYNLNGGSANSAPVAMNVSISGVTAIDEILTGTYTYNDAEGDLQGTSTFRWLRDNVAIAGATGTTYTLVGADVGTTIKFEVTPVALTGTSPGAAVQSAGAGPITDGGTQFAETFNGMTSGQRIGQQTGWYDAGSGPTIGSTNGVNSSQGLGSASGAFTWTAHTFNWNNPALTQVILGMDFESSASGTFDDDRVCWTVNNASADSRYEFGVQLDNSDGGIVTYWRTAITGDTRVQTPIVALSGIANSTWYRLRATITKLTSTTASIAVSLQRLDGSGNPTGTPITGTLANTGTWAGGVPDNGYFTPTSMWPAYKNFNNVAGDADNAYFEIVEGPVNYAPVASSVNITGTPTQAQMLTANYAYSDAEGDLEGVSTFRWLRDNVAIAGATSSTYTLVAEDVDAMIKCEVTPVALTGTSPGAAVQSTGVGPIVDPSEVLYIATGAVWKYLDNGSNQGTAWSGLAFNDAAWAAGPAELGYNTDGTEPDEATVVSYGPSSTNKYITTYFRRSFEVADPTKVGTLELRLLRDDGAIVYINGTEVYRTNMPAGSVTYTTLASSAISGSGETTFLTTAIPTGALVAGTNVLAVEIHQNGATSTDISFNLSLTGTVLLPKAKFYVSVSGSDATGDGSLANPFRTIQKGVTTAGSTDTVQVLAGTYVEAVNVNKSLVLLGSGAGSTTIEAPADFATNSAYNYARTNFVTERAIVHAGTSSAINVIIRDFTIDGQSRGPAIAQAVAYSGLLAEGCNITVTGCTIRNIMPADPGSTWDPGRQYNGRGIHVRGSGAVAVIDGNTFEEINRLFIMINATDQTENLPAVFPQATVSNNVLTGKGPYAGGQRGIWFNAGAWGTVAGNTLTNMDFPDAPIEPERASGIVVRFGELNPAKSRTIRNNVLTSATHINNKGMYIQGSGDSVLENTITGYRWGIELHDGVQANVLRNTITGGLIGVLVTSEHAAGAADLVTIGGSASNKNTITGQDAVAGAFAVCLSFRDPLDNVTFMSSTPVDARYNDFGVYTKSAIRGRIWDRADTTLIGGNQVDTVLFYPFYAPGAPFTISGNAGVSGATLSYMDVTPKTATADGSGIYALDVEAGWSGTVTPSKPGYTFTPSSRMYNDVAGDLTGENYTATIQASPGWTAYNDVVFRASDQTIGPNVTRITIGSGNPGPTTGSLRKQSDSSSTGVTATFTQSGTVNWQPDATTGGDNPDAGTDAYTTFCGLMDIGGVVYYGSNPWWVDLTLTGLDPSKEYTFATTAVRNDPTYTDRFSKFTLSGATAFTNASTAGVTSPSPDQAIFNAGDNSTEGYVARWTGIQPGEDGTIKIRAEAAYPSTQYKAYAFSVFMLQEAPVAANVVANVKAILQGPYVVLGDTMSAALRGSALVPKAHPYGGTPWNYAGTDSVSAVPEGVVDWVMVELRADTTLASMVARRAAFIKKDGSIVDLDGTSPVSFPGPSAGSYYIVVRHRNHLAVMSHDAVVLNDASALYDFTTGLDKYFRGDAALLTAGKYGMWGGDADASGDVAALDRTATWNLRNQVGYLLPDVDLSGDVAALDRTLTWNNRNKFTQVP